MSSAQVSDVTIECVRGDITCQPDLDAIVNAANAELAPGGGVAGAIHRVAGPGLYDECRGLAPIRTGQAVITAGHGLPNRYCIHALGPVYASSADPGAELASCYAEALALADSRSLASIGFPAISTGIFGYPTAEAAAVSLHEVIRHAPALRSVRLVRFVLFGAADLDVFHAALARRA